MKNMIRCLSIVATVTLLALPAFANGVNSRVTDTVQDPCSTEGKIALYAEFYKELKGDQAKAYEAAKKYVACPPAAADPANPASKEAEEAEAKRITYLKGFITRYEKANRFTKMTVALNDKKYADAFAIGKEIASEDPENPGLILDLVFAGYASSNASLDADTVVYAKKAIQLLESGKAPEKWVRFQSKDDALAWSNYIIATRSAAKSSWAEAIPYFIKAASYESTIKKLPLTYSSLGEAYEKGPYAKLSADYKAKFEGKDETPDSKLAIENINQVVDRMIDAYARAVALAGTDAQYAEIKAKSLDAATFYYKVRHDKSDAGLNEMIASVLSKPLPPEPTPLTSLPTPPVTPASGPGTSTTGAAPTANGTATQGPAKTPASSTAKAPGPTKPKLHRAHAQR